MTRPLDEYEQALLDGLRAGARDALSRDALSLDVKWHDGPVFVLRPSLEGLASYWWASANPHWRRADQTVVEFAVGDFSVGIVGKLGSTGPGSLVESVARLVRALIDGRATYSASKADPSGYDGPIDPEALELLIEWSYQTDDGSGGGVLRAYLGDPDAFSAVTGVPISAQSKRTHPLSLLTATA